jgi:hypothetical protein
VRPSLFHLARERENFLILRLNRHLSPQDALAKAESVFKKYTPDVPFEYSFVDEEYARKFSNEERIGKAGYLFCRAGHLHSCLGLFGLASFVAEQRTKEIGIRKVLGASVPNLWGLLSKDFLGWCSFLRHRYAPGLVRHEPVDRQVRVPHRHSVVGVWGGGHGGVAHYAAHGQLPGHPGRPGQPGEVAAQ